jgi:hypothetical protein
MAIPQTFNIVLVRLKERTAFYQMVRTIMTSTLYFQLCHTLLIESTLSNTLEKNFNNPEKSSQNEYSTNSRNFRACRLRNKVPSVLLYEEKSDSETSEEISSGGSVVTESDESSNLADSDDTEGRGNVGRRPKNRLTKRNTRLKTKKNVAYPHKSKYKASDTSRQEDLTTSWTRGFPDGSNSKYSRKNGASHLESDTSSYAESGRRYRSRITTQKKQSLPALRASTRHATMSQPNFSQLLQSSSSASSSDDDMNTFVESKTPVQNVEKVLGYRFLKETGKKKNLVAF